MAMACSSSSASTPRTTAPNCFRSLASRSKSRAHATDILITRSRVDRQKSGSSSETVSSIARAHRGGGVGTESAVSCGGYVVDGVWHSRAASADFRERRCTDPRSALYRLSSARRLRSVQLADLCRGAAAKQIAAAVRRRAMPPWKPEPGYGEFVGSRLLTDAQIAAITGWVDLTETRDRRL